MKKGIIIIFSFIWLSVFSQGKENLEPPNKTDCYIINDTSHVINGRIYIILPDTSKQISINYCQIDSIRVTFDDSCIIAHFIKNGILNGNLLKNIGFHLVKYEDIKYETYIQKIKNETGSLETWNGYYIFFGIEELDYLKTDKQRIFKLTSYEGEGDESSIFYLEFENLSATKITTLHDFIKNAKISCLKSWYMKF